MSQITTHLFLVQTKKNSIILFLNVAALFRVMMYLVTTIREGIKVHRRDCPTQYAYNQTLHIEY